MAESLGSAVLTVSVDNTQFNAGLNAARGSADKAASQITQSFGGITNALKSLAGVAGIVGIGALTQQLIATGQESQKAQIQLRSLAGAYGESNAAAEAAVRIQKVLGISSVDATQGFAQLFAALRGTGIGLKQLEVLFVGISNAARLSGAGTQEAQAALLQLKQGLASGVLQGDELRSVLEQLPAFAKAIADQLQTNVGNLRKLGSEGKITSEIVFNAAKQLASATVPGRTELENLGIAFENVKAQAAAALGPPLTAILQTTAAGLVAFKAFLEENQQALINVGRSVLEIGKTFAPFVAGILAVQAALKAWAIASKAVAVAQAAVLALQGPKGWAVLAGAVAASALAAQALEKTLEGVSRATGKAKEEAQKALKEFRSLLSGTNLDQSAEQRLRLERERTKEVQNRFDIERRAELQFRQIQRQFAIDRKAAANEYAAIEGAIDIQRKRSSLGLGGTGVGALQELQNIEAAKRGAELAAVQRKAAEGRAIDLEREAQILRERQAALESPNSGATRQEINAAVDAALQARNSAQEAKNQYVLAGDALKAAGAEIVRAAETAKGNLQDAFKTAKDAVRNITRGIEDSVTALSELQNPTGSGLNKFLGPNTVASRQQAVADRLRPEADALANQLGIRLSFSGTREDVNKQTLEFIKAARQELRMSEDINRATAVDLPQATADLATVNDSLVKVNSQLADATNNLAQKDWAVNVSVNANTGDYAVNLG